MTPVFKLGLSYQISFYSGLWESMAAMIDAFWILLRGRNLKHEYSLKQKILRFCFSVSCVSFIGAKINMLPYHLLLVCIVSCVLWTHVLSWHTFATVH